MDGMCLADVFPPDDQPAEAHVLAALSADPAIVTPGTSCAARGRHADGAVLECRVQLTPMELDGNTMFSVRDHA